MTRRKELNFFIEEMEWPKGLKWYADQFESGAGRAIRGESYPHYTRSPISRSVPERMYAVIPDARLIYLLRDPMERITSGVDDSFTSPDFAVEMNTREIKRKRNWMGELMGQIVNLRPGPILPGRLRISRRVPFQIRMAIEHRTLRSFSTPLQRPRPSPELERQLLDLFHDDVEKLRRPAGKKFQGWCV